MIRITGGEFKGHAIQVPHEGTRPTHSLLRQAILNSIQFKVEGSRVLDLYAGSGALGFEALSRGAKEAVFVDESRTASKLIYQNAKSLKVLDRITNLQGAVDKCIIKLEQIYETAGGFDFIFADPPYGYDQETYLLNDFPWGAFLNNGGLMFVEWSKQKTDAELLLEKVAQNNYQLLKVREKYYGETALTTYEKSDLSGVI